MRCDQKSRNGGGVTTKFKKVIRVKVVQFVIAKRTK